MQLNNNVADKFNSGVNQVFGTKLDTNAAKRYNKEFKDAETATEEMRLKGGRLGGTDWIKAGTGLVAELPFFFGGTGTTTTLATRALDQGLRGAAVGAAQYADSDKERIVNMAGGAAGAAAGQAGGELVAGALSKGVAKGVNAVKGNLKPKAQEIAKLGERFGVRTSVGDIGQGAFTKRVETQLEQVPILGMTGFREKQASEAGKAAQEALDKLKKNMTDLDYKELPKIRAAANSGDRNAARIVEKIDSAGNDSDRILQAAGEVRLFRENKIATKKYDKVEQEVVKAGNSTVATTNLDDILDRAIKEQTVALSPDEALLRELETIKANLADPAKPKDFNNMRQLRSQLGSLADELGQSGKGAASKTIGDIRKAVDDDIADFALNSGNPAIKKSYQAADSYYKAIMARRDKAIAKSLDSNKPDEIYEQFVKAGKSDRAENFYRALDAKGQAALRYQMAENAMGKAVNESKDQFSPAKFAREFERLSEPYSRIFKGDDKKQMDGLVKLMRHIERAGQYKENPPTGNRIIPWLIGGASVANPALVGKIGGASLFAKTLLTTKAGKNLLLSADKLSPDKQVAMDNIVKAAAKLAAAQGSSAGREAANSVAGTKIRDDSNVLTPSF